jgi:ABC-type multidrug transport system ATPase subunit
MSTLEIAHISKSYNHLVLNDVSFDVQSSNICGLLGVNGAGKSTLFKIICGLVKPDGGKISLNGSALVRGTYGFMIENPSFDEELTGYENLFGLSLLFDGIGKNKILDVLSKTGLEKKKDVRVKNFSLGMKQRLYFAYALMNDPKALFLDEPFNGLDPVSTRDMENCLIAFAKAGGIVLLSSHMIGEIEHLCQSVVIIDKGTVVYQNSDISNVDLRKVFFASVMLDGTAQ